MVDRKLTGAHYGLKDWIMQRITAVLMILFTILFLSIVLILPDNYEAWRAFFAHTLVRIVTQIFVLAVALHAWVGIRDLWMDYVKPAAIRLTMHVLTILWLVGTLIYSIKVIWGV